MKSLKKASYRLVFIIAFVVLSITGFAQPEKGIEQLLPVADVNQSIDIIHKQIMGIQSFVNIGLIASINNYNACSDNSISSNGMKISIAWYNTNDETGKFMLSTLKDLGGITQDMNTFKNESGFDLNEAKETIIEGGKLWIIAKQKECVNEITGATGQIEYFTHLRCFLFNGIYTLKIDLQGLSKPEKLKEMMYYTINEASKFDFSTLTNVVSTQ